MDNQKSIPPALIGLSTIIAIQIVGFALLWNEITSQQQYIYLPVENKQDATTGTQTTPVVTVTKFPTESVLRETIQSVFKQELAPYIRQLAATPETTQKTSSTEPTSIKEGSPLNNLAFSEARNIVDGALAQGTWSLEDNAKLLSLANRLTSSQRKNIMEELIQAANRQELKLIGAFPAL